MMERNKKLEEACQQAKIRYMSKKLCESTSPEWAVWVKTAEGKWKPWGARDNFPSTQELEEMRDWLFDRGYTDITVLKNNGSRPVVGMRESAEEDVKEVAELEKTPDTPVTPKEFNAATMINNLIQDEWQAIQGYNDAVATFTSIGIDESIINIFKDIANEENVHVGQLQKALELVSPNVESIKKGEDEASKQLEAPVEDGSITDKE